MGGLQASPPGASPLTVLALCWISTDAVGWVPRDPTQAGVAGGGRLAWYHKLALGWSDSFS
jgi:hypothetical protein